MPVIIVDTEQADLIDAALEMYEAALRARSKRADPEKIISDSLLFSAGKLATVRRLLLMPDPPEFSALREELRRAAISHMSTFQDQVANGVTDAAWRRIREIAIAPAFPQS